MRFILFAVFWSAAWPALTTSALLAALLAAKTEPVQVWAALVVLAVGGALYQGMNAVRKYLQTPPVQTLGALTITKDKS